MSQIEMKTFSVSYDEYSLLLCSLIDSRSYYEQMLVAASIHPERFENTELSHIPTSIARISSMLSRLGVEVQA